jgi:hypothetical protein
MTDLPAYSGPLAVCPKCRTPGASMKWHSLGGAFAPRKRGEITSSYPCRRIRDLDGHLCRVCRNCGYGWVEASADSQPEEPS